ncbi:CpsB/CapC family capsule biosynthesis tyrosine phosphatase [Aurantimonas sp. A2-1-M11]|uniref:tyrosine-protein phosphatase n=1 Tax=Aurantimonas sp. A2-1-M11 TaxID=3113712 RepID=UPI002F94A2D0
MIDLHSHILCGIDDGAKSLDISVEMARMAVEDGVQVMACTPHIVPGVYLNEPSDIARRVGELKAALAGEGIALSLVSGADVHIAPDLLSRLSSEAPPTLNGSNYFLFEPPHHVLPPRLVAFSRGLISSGFVPILTHPERLSWVSAHYEIIRELAGEGVLMQVTAGSLTGDFGRSAQKLADRLVEEGLCDILASDAHNTEGRPPGLSKARAIVAERRGDDEAEAVVLGRPRAILANAPVERSVVDRSSRRVSRSGAAGDRKAGQLQRLLSKMMGGR